MATSTTGSSLAAAGTLGCYVDATAQLVAFVLDIPRNCVDLAWRSHTSSWGTPLYVFPACVFSSVYAAGQLSGSLFKQCHH